MQPLVQGYDELRLRLDRREAGRYHVFASTRDAEASRTFELPFSDLEIENFILRVSRPRGRRRITTSAMDEARRMGGGLFSAMFAGEVLALYRETLARARGQDRGVRITICLSEAPELVDVPWEYLFDEPDFLAVSAFTPVVRYLDLPRGHRPLQITPPLRVLGVVSNPADHEQLDVEREQANLTRALSEVISAGAVELHWLERPTLGGLLRALQSHQFHALHYIGHGTYDPDAGRGVLLFEDEAGWSRPVGGDKLGMVLHDFSSLRLAVLNACEGARTSRSDPFAGVAGSLVQRDIPAVVAMQFEISDEAAIVFAGGFYRPLAAGSPVDASLARARLAMLAERGDDLEWGTPVLFMRVPDGRIFELDSRSNAAASGELVGATAAGATMPARPGSGAVTGHDAVPVSVGAPRGTGVTSDAVTSGDGARAPVSAGATGAQRHRRRVLASSALGALLVVGAGTAVALMRGGSPAARTHPPTATARPFTIVYTRPWRPVTRSVVGAFALSRRTPEHGYVDSDVADLASGTTTLAAGTLATSSVIPGGAPPALVARYGPPLTSTAARVAGYSGRAYTWAPAGSAVVAYVLPTSGGDAAIICAAPASATATLPQCGALAAGARASSVAIVAPGPDRRVARTLAGALAPVRAARSIVTGVRGALPARARAVAAVARAETRAVALLGGLASPARYHGAVARLAAALAGEAAPFTALSRAARRSDRAAYAGDVRNVAAASRRLSAAARAMQGYRLGVPALTVLGLPGPPPLVRSSPAPTPTPATTPTAPSSTQNVPPPTPSSPQTGTTTTPFS
jgi:CHAT domain